MTGVFILFLTLRRSTVENALRFLWAGIFLYLASFHLRHPELLPALTFWVLALCLFVAIIGGLVPLRGRRNAYGLLVASLWALLIGSILDSGLAGKAGTFVFGAGVLVGLTMLYLGWATKGELPSLMRKVLDQLPKDDRPIISSLEIAKQPEPVSVPIPVGEPVETQTIGR